MPNRLSSPNPARRAVLVALVAAPPMAARRPTSTSKYGLALTDKFSPLADGLQASFLIVAAL